MEKHQKPLYLTVISDIHYYSKKTGVSGKAYDFANAKSQKLLADCPEVLEAAFRQIAKDQRSEIVLLSGDTTNNGEVDSHRECLALLRRLKDAGKRVYVLTSTHDYQESGETEGYAGDEKIQVPALRREELWELYRPFGPDEALAVHRESMSYIVQLAEGYRLFALNDDSNGAGKSGFSDECFQWIAQQARKAREEGQFIIAMTHHPMLSPSPFYSIIGAGDMMGDHARRVQEFADLGIQFMLTGHTHMQDVSYAVSEKGNLFYDLSTPALCGYPGTIRQLTLDPAAGEVRLSTDLITEPVALDLGEKTLQEHFTDQFIGMIRDVILAAGEDTDRFANMATAFSVKKKLSYRIGWLIKGPARLLARLKIGTVGNWTRAETGLSKADYAAIREEKVLDFIISLVLSLYGGDAPYTPDTPHYKITCGVLNIIDSVLRVLHIRLGKLIKGVDSVRSLVEPLLYNAGICDAKAVLPVYPVASPDDPAAVKAREDARRARPLPVPEQAADTVRPSRKGLPIVVITVLCLLVLLPVLLVALGIGFLVNQVRYGKQIAEAGK